MGQENIKFYNFILYRTSCCYTRQCRYLLRYTRAYYGRPPEHK